MLKQGRKDQVKQIKKPPMKCDCNDRFDMGDGGGCEAMIWVSLGCIRYQMGRLVSNIMVKQGQPTARPSYE